MVEDTVTLEGHIIDSDVLRRVLDKIVEQGARFEFEEFRIGRTNEEASFARLAVRADQPEALDRVLESLSYLGASVAIHDAGFAPAEADGILPDEFYSTTNLDTLVRVEGRWEAVQGQRMDCAVVRRAGRLECVKQRKVRGGDPVLLRGGGVRVRPAERSRRASAFGFMSNEISMEVNKPVAIAAAATAMRDTRTRGERIVVVPGPAVIHSGGDAALARLIRGGWIDGVLSGNAFAVHDVEKALLSTSLGVCQLSGRAVEGGSRNHLWAINAVNRVGGIRKAVECGLVGSGVMHAVVVSEVPFVLAGSIRDDGPLVDVITDVLAAQEAYIEALEGVGMCLLLASALHSIAVGNLIHSRVRTVCVDMTEALPVKLGNRGSQQAIGLVTDVGYFLEGLERELSGGPRAQDRACPKSGS
ncbi:MAG: TIGR00300 family protein [Planctomycetes bacterium]|nr:TIGR00300 family protein [Planctomycetota bacterium]MCB9870199.1 TIGR00300 family protein [Planctomycetota bacterium]MCB9888221.1 TIGR00300 family protein [Planctomycetota bacterium]